MVRYGIEIAAGSLRAAAALMVSLSHRGGPSEAGALAALASRSLPPTTARTPAR